MRQRVLIAVMVVAMSSLTWVSNSGGASATSTSTTPTPATPPPASTTTSTTSSTQNPFDETSMAAYLRGRVNEVAIGVYDVTSHMTYLYRPLVHERTASMAKIDILADLLYEHQLTRRPLTSHQKYLATVMIELSNNSAATQLWNAIGGRDAINTFNTMIGYRQTIAGYGWGNIETTPRDELQLLKVIALPNRYLTTSSRNFEMQLMERVTPGERFGLGVGSPSGATVGLKDGYYNESDTGWQLNSAGYVEYQGRFYLACIMTTYNSDESYGITTLNDVAGLLWRDLRP